MRAAVVQRYGPPEVVRMAEVPRPEPGRGEVLVRVRSVAVTSADARIRAARFPRGFGVLARLAFGVRRPRRSVLGSAFAGTVEALGPRVDGVAIGDDVCGMTGISMGAHAEYLTLAAAKAVPVPPTVGHDEAAALLFGGSTALHFIRDKADVGPGTTVLVVGASGAVGSSAVQIARHLGATVTGVCSGANADLVTRLGADRVIDHTRTDLADVSDRFDVVLDTVGTVSIRSGRRLLAPGGRLLLAVAGLGETLRARGDVVAGPAKERVEDFAHLLDLAASGHLDPVIDDVLDLDDVVRAHQRVDTGRKVGNLVLRP
ncbi:GroES-like protein [Aeromicrobium marinum DSM 15272]|uniref:GroES-like protein n=1 Tax=Aeromicrobium marinum DSM 15272 TaxID=585531 RepID=E2SCI3_9ACTN|nr:NAD(P)-dependent alcohol dehydrogenase [Aeromicrobium marinum]EFQ82936.1 GroES-like protein [Aeromicrobium marinum DSM 15272]